MEKVVTKRKLSDFRKRPKSKDLKTAEELMAAMSLICTTPSGHRGHRGGVATDDRLKLEHVLNSSRGTPEIHASSELDENPNSLLDSDGFQRYRGIPCLL